MLGLREIEETCSSNSYLCRNCDIKLLRLSELEHQLKQCRSELELHIASFHLKPSTISCSSEFSSTSSSLKRSGSVPCNTQCPHLQSEIQQAHNQPTVSAVSAQ